MIDTAMITAIVSQYTKHEWTLRCVLLSDDLRKRIQREAGELFDNAEIIYSDIDALWFSRSSRAGVETWELRRMDHSAYALDVFLNDEMSPTERNEILRNTEERLRAHSAEP